MVDAVVIRLEAMEQNVGQSVWNRDIVIYQTVNDFPQVKFMTIPE